MKAEANFRYQRFSELVAQGAAFDLPSRTSRKIAKLEGTIRDPDQAVHGKAKMFQDFLDLTVLAFTQPQGQPDIRPLLAFKQRFNATIENAVNGNAIGEFVEFEL